MQNLKQIMAALALTALIFGNLSAQESQTIYKDFCNANYKQIRYGQRSEAIRDLQKILNFENKLNTNTTGYFGPGTRSNIKIFQKNNFIVQTGTIGPTTYKSLSTKYCINTTVKTESMPSVNIPENPVSEATDSYTVYEEIEDVSATIAVGVYNPNATPSEDKSKMKINRLEAVASFGGSSSNYVDNFVEFTWEATAVDSCDIYFVSDNSIKPNKREIILKDLKTSGNLNKQFFGFSKTNDHAKNYSIFQMDCKNDSQKKIVRKTVDALKFFRTKRGISY